MIGKVFGIICVISCFFGCLSGNIAEVNHSVLDGASAAVELTVGLIGIMGLWGGIMRVAQVTGATKKAAVLFTPLLKILFPDACKKKNGVNELTAALTANLLGLGNAATPLAIKAMEKLQENNENKDTATTDMVMFTVLGTVPLSVFPSTLIAIRQTAGSANAFEIIVPVFVCSLVCNVFAVVVVKALSVFISGGSKK